MNLYELIKKHNFQGFSIHLIRRWVWPCAATVLLATPFSYCRIAFSLLHCLDLLRQQRIIHCDLKPVRRWRSSLFYYNSLFVCRKIYWWSLALRAPSRSLTLGQAVTSINASTRTSSHGSTDHPKLYSVRVPSIVGHLWPGLWPRGA